MFSSGEILSVAEVLVSEIRSNPLQHATLGELARDVGREAAVGHHSVDHLFHRRTVGYVNCVHLRGIVVQVYTVSRCIYW